MKTSQPCVGIAQTAQSLLPHRYRHELALLSLLMAGVMHAVTGMAAPVNNLAPSIEQLVPCDGPVDGGRWRNHGQYVSAVADAVNRLANDGLLTRREGKAIVADAARSDCGGSPLTAPDNVEIHEGYSMELLIGALDFPTSIAFSPNRLWIAEAGIAMRPPQIKEIDDNGRSAVVLTGTMLGAGELLGPINDLTWDAGWLWVSHRQVGANNWLVGAISKFHPDNPAGTFTTVISDLPSSGDHATGEIVFDRSGRLYFSQGTASNLGLIGADNDLLEEWLGEHPTFHDFPAKDIVLSGASYQTVFPFSLDPGATEETAPFMRFGSGPAPRGTVVRGATPFTPQEGMIAGVGAVYSFMPGKPRATWRLEGWGMRNPFGIGIDPFNPHLLFVSNNGGDVRNMITNGSRTVLEGRSIANDWDDIFVLPIGGEEEFFGWPDYFHHPHTCAVMPITNPMFCYSPTLPIRHPQFVLEENFRLSLRTQPAFVELENHSSATKLDFARHPGFGFVGDLFVGESGAFVPTTGAAKFAGYKVVRVDRQTRRVSNFVAHNTRTREAIFDPAGFNKPLDVKFRGGRMFIVDLGVVEPGLGLMEPGTGKVWIVSKDSQHDRDDNR